MRASMKHGWMTKPWSKVQWKIIITAKDALFPTAHKPWEQDGFYSATFEMHPASSSVFARHASVSWIVVSQANFRTTRWTTNEFHSLGDAPLQLAFGSVCTTQLSCGIRVLRKISHQVMGNLKRVILRSWNVLAFRNWSLSLFAVQTTETGKKHGLVAQQALVEWRVLGFTSFKSLGTSQCKNRCLVHRSPKPWFAWHSHNLSQLLAMVYNITKARFR